MRYALLLLLTTIPIAAARAQDQTPAEIVRQAPAEAAALPNAPQPVASQAQRSADRQWEQLLRSTRYARPEIRIQAVGDPIRCDVDKVTPDEIFCTEHRSRGLADVFLPREEYHVPQREIRDVRAGGRGASMLLGLGIGIGVGVGLGSINDATRTDGGEVYFALLFGGLGALIGHAIPMAGHAIYRQP